MSFQTGRAFEHIDKLAYEIGPRPAGGKGDRLAAEYIQTRFSDSGLEVRTLEFKFVDRQLKRKAMAFLFGVPFVLISVLPPLSSLLVWLIAILCWRALGKLLPKRTSANIVAKSRAEKPKKTVVLSAHFDTAPCRVSRKFALFIRFSFPPIAILVLILVSARLFWRIENWALLWSTLAVYFVPLCGYLLYTGSIRKASPGANDNASGVAVMLEVARILGRSPPPDTQLIFIASGGEEQGLVGMRKIAKEKMLPAGAKVLNLDGVGFGHQPFVIEGNGILRKTKTSEDLNRLLEKSIERSKLKPARWWVPIARHDHIPLLKAGFDATTLTFDELGDEGGWLARAFRLRNARRRRYPQLHTKDDLPECLSLETVERAGEIALDFLKEA